MKLIFLHIALGLLLIKTDFGLAQNIELFDLFRLSSANNVSIDEARKYYNDVLSHSPQLVNAYNERGFAELLSKNFSNAVSDFEKSIQLQPKQNMAYLFLAVTYSVLGNAKQAKKKFKMASLESDNILMFKNYYTIYSLYSGNTKNACRYIKELENADIQIDEDLKKKCN